MACFSVQLDMLEGCLPETLERGVWMLVGWQTLCSEDEKMGEVGLVLLRVC